MSKSALLALAIASILQGQSKPILRPTIKGDLLLTLEAAVSEFRLKFKMPQIENYEISIMESGDEVIVIFQNEHRPAGARGNPGPLPEFEVVLNPKHKVLRSNFVR